MKKIKLLFPLFLLLIFSSCTAESRMTEEIFFDQLKSEINTTDTLDLYFTDLNSDGNMDVIMRPVETVTGTAMGVFEQMYFWVYDGEKFVKAADMANYSEEYAFCVRSCETDGGLFLMNGAYTFFGGTDSSRPEKMISEDLIRITFSSDKMPQISAERIMYQQKDFETNTCIGAYVRKSLLDELGIAVNDSSEKYDTVTEEEYREIYEQYLNALAPGAAIKYGRFTAEERNQYESRQLAERLVTNHSTETLFPENAKALTDSDENEFTINSEKAMSDLIDALVISEKWREDFKLICPGMAALNKEAYYQITLNSENDFSYSNIATFWVNANSGAIYLKYDPTLDAGRYFSEFSGDIPEDDGRTRLVAFP